MPPIDEFMGWVFKALIAGVMSFLWWGKREDKKTLDTHSMAITKLQSQAVTEDKVREIVTEVTHNAIGPMSAGIAEIKKLVLANTDITKELQIKMATQEGYQRAIKELTA